MHHHSEQLSVVDIRTGSGWINGLWMNIHVHWMYDAYKYNILFLCMRILQIRVSVLNHSCTFLYSQTNEWHFYKKTNMPTLGVRKFSQKYFIVFSFRISGNDYYIVFLSRLKAGKSLLACPRSVLRQMITRSWFADSLIYNNYAAPSNVQKPKARQSRYRRPWCN